MSIPGSLSVAHPLQPTTRLGDVGYRRSSTNFLKDDKPRAQDPLSSIHEPDDTGIPVV